MSHIEVTKEELLQEIQELKKEIESLKFYYQNDITVRQKSENALIDNEESFKMLFDKAPLGYQSLDFNGNFIVVNQQWLDTLGYERDEVIGKWFGDFLTPVYKEGFRKRFPLFKERGKIHSEFEMVHKNGSILFIAFEGRIGYEINGEFKQTHCILQDITERKHAEEALRVSEERFRLLHENAGIGIGYYKLDGTVISYNRIAAKNMNGLPEDFNGKSIYELFPKQEAEFYYNRIINASQSEEPVVYEDFVPLTSGEKYFLSTFTKITDTNHNVLGIQIMSQDITKLKQEEGALRESEKRLKLATSSGLLGIWDWNVKDNLMVWDDRMFELYGINRDSSPNNIDAWVNGLHPEDKQRALDECNDALYNDKDFDTTFRVLHTDGKVLYLKANGLVIKDNEGKPVRMLGINRDITARKRAEEALSESEEKFRTISQLTPAGIYLTGPDGNCSYVNSQWQEMSGLSFEEAIGLGWINGIFHEDRQSVFDNWNKMVESNGKWGYEYRFQNKNGQITWVFGLATPLTDTEGNIYAYVGLNNDITERKLAEEALNKEKKFVSEILESINDAFFTLDDNLVVMYFNKAAEKLLYKKREEVIGRYLFDAFPEAKGSIFEENYTKAICEKCFMAFEVYFDVEPYREWYDVRVYPQGNGVSIFFQLTTERKKAEEKIKKSEEKFREIFESSGDGIFFLSFATEIVEINESFAKMHGYTIEEMKNIKLEELDVDNISQVVPERLERINNSENLQFEVRHYHKDGHIIELEVSTCLISLENEKLIVAFHRDITERKQAEEALLESENKFKGLFDNMSSCCAVYEAIDNGENFIFKNFNHSAERVNLVKSEEIIGKCVTDVFPGVKDFGLFDVFKRVWKSGVSEHHPVNLYHDGRISGWYENFIYKLSSGEIVAIYDDITERKKDEEKLLEQNQELEQQYEEYMQLNEVLRQTNYDLEIAKDKAEESEKQYKSLSENSKDYIMRFDRNHKHLYINNITYDLLQIKPEQLLNKTHSESGLFSDEQCNYWEHNISKVFETKEIIQKQFDFDNGNEIKYFDWMLIPEKNEKGIVENVLSVSRDITKLKQYESELILAKEKAEESDKLKTAFLQNMSHEIRTPLNGILGFSNLLQDDDIEKEDIKEYTLVIQQSGNRLLEIINNVLDISKIETGQVTINKKAFLINTIFSDLLTFFTPFADSKNIKLNYHNLNDTNRLIYSDETKLNQILINLINNSIKFTNKGSIDFGFNIEDNFIHFYVKDTGTGISSEYYKKIFDRFVQVDLKLTRGYEGAGLGLAICKGLVELLGGKIWLESEIGKGTTFFFTIPLIEIENESKNESSEIVKKKSPSSGTILIAEDDWTSFQYIYKLLAKSEITILHAENGEKAVEFIKNVPDISLILMDIKMPVMNGIEATKIIKQLRPDLPIIAQTAYAFSTERAEILSIGCNDYISKPISKESLLKLIERYSK